MLVKLRQITCAADLTKCHDEEEPLDGATSIPEIVSLVAEGVGCVYHDTGLVVAGRTFCFPFLNIEVWEFIAELNGELKEATQYSRPILLESL